MKAVLTASALCLATLMASSQSSHDLEQQVARGVADLSRSRVKQLSSGDWLRERLEIDSIAQGLEQADATATVPRSVVRMRVLVHRTQKVSESMVRTESLPMQPTAQRYEVEMHFEPDAAYGLWVFVGGRYWILDDTGKRRLELTMFSDLLHDAPLDAPHELAWAIMSP